MASSLCSRKGEVTEGPISDLTVRFILNSVKFMLIETYLKKLVFFFIVDTFNICILVSLKSL